ncbi:uncharacterized protein LOC144701041 [Wolffia australiana]
MDAIQIVSSAAQIVSCMLQAVSALREASSSISDAPKKIRNLESFATELESLARRARQKHGHKLHDLRLERQMQSLAALVDRLHNNIRKMRSMSTKNKGKKMIKVVWFSISGDPFARLIDSVYADLNGWLELQTLSENVMKAIDSTAENATSVPRVCAEKGYPLSTKCCDIKRLLEQEDSHRVILIVGLSGIGKSCLARQVASDPPKIFVDGAVELVFGQWCSRAASHGSREEYERRLLKKLCRLLVKLGSIEKTPREDMSMDLEDACCKLQTALAGKSILLLLDDVWEQDIVERFTKLYDNGCKYLVTTRNEGVYEITEAEKVEITKDSAMEMSKEILLYHSLLTRDELPPLAEDLLDRCGHHPLTVAVMGKALRKETSTDKWKKAIANLSSYATCTPGPVSYVNEKACENTLTIFGSFEFSLQDMPDDSRVLFTILAAISWVEPVPEICLEALWSALGLGSFFPLAVGKLVEGSLLMKADLGYLVHDMVALYLESMMSNAIETLLTGSSDKAMAGAAPWLFIFGKEEVKNFAMDKMKTLISLSHEMEAAAVLESMFQALMASKSISELEASRKSFSQMVGPRVLELVSSGSPATIAALAKVITNLLSKEDYLDCAFALEQTEALDKLLEMLINCSEPATQASLLSLVAKLAEHGSFRMIKKVLTEVPLSFLAELLSPQLEQCHDSAFAAILSLAKAGKSEAVQLMVEAGIDQGLVCLLEQGSEVVQHHAMVVLKVFHEQSKGNQLACFQPGRLNLLPWNVRIRLERFVLSDDLLKPQTMEDIVGRVAVARTTRDFIPIIEKAGDPTILNMILNSPLVSHLADSLRNSNSSQEKVESALLVTKLACTGGEPAVRALLRCDVALELVKMMNHGQTRDVQDAAYNAFHQMVFLAGEEMMKPRLMEEVVQLLGARNTKAREVGMLSVLDMMEMGSKPGAEQMLGLQVVEKLVGLEKAGGIFRGVLINLLKALDKCKNLSVAERRVVRQQVWRKIRAANKGHKMEPRVMEEVENYLSNGSGGSSSRSGSRGKR